MPDTQNWVEAFAANDLMLVANMSHSLHCSSKKCAHSVTCMHNTAPKEQLDVLRATILIKNAIKTTYLVDPNESFDQNFT